MSVYDKRHDKVIIFWMKFSLREMCEYESISYNCSINEAIVKAEQIGFKKPSLLKFWRYLIPAGFIVIDGVGVSPE